MSIDRPLLSLSPLPNARIEAGIVRPQVIVVDEYAPAAASLSELLHMLGCEVIVATDAVLAVTLAARCEPDLLFMDIDTNVCNPFEAAQDLQRQADFSKCTFVATTDDSIPDPRFLQDVFDYVLVKPFAPFAIERIVNIARTRISSEPPPPAC